MSIHITGLPAVLAVMLAIGGLADVLTTLTRPLAHRYAIRLRWLTAFRPHRYIDIPYLQIARQWARPGGYVRLPDGQLARLVTIVRGDECQAPDPASAWPAGEDGYMLDDGEPAKWHELATLTPAPVPDARRLSRLLRRRAAA